MGSITYRCPWIAGKILHFQHCAHCDMHSLPFLIAVAILGSLYVILTKGRREKGLPPGVYSLPCECGDKPNSPQAPLLYRS